LTTNRGAVKIVHVALEEATNREIKNLIKKIKKFLTSQAVCDILYKLSKNSAPS